MHIEDWPLAKIRPYPNNPRVLRNAAEKVAESIKAFGWRQPIVVDAEGVIIVGHSRLEAAKLLKLATAPVHVARELTADQVRALRVADNKTAEFAAWDEAKLADELAEIMAGMGDVSVTGFSQAEFDALEMRAKADLERFVNAQPTAAGAPAADDGDDDDFDLGGDAQEEDAGSDRPDAGAESEDAPPHPDLVPFNALMTVENRQVVYDAIAQAKRQHALETTADALLVIARSYLDA